jgi:hypothetical protein
MIRSAFVNDGEDMGIAICETIGYGYAIGARGIVEFHQCHGLKFGGVVISRLLARHILTHRFDGKPAYTSQLFRCASIISGKGSGSIEV